MMPSSRPLRWEEMHYRLVSLWDLMIMIELPLGSLISALNRIGTMGSGLKDMTQRALFLKHDIDGLKEAVELVRQRAEELGLPASIEASKRIHVIFARATQETRDGHELAVFNKIDTPMLGGSFGSLVTSFRDETAGRFALVIPTSKVELYEQKRPPFGAEVDTKFRTRGRDEIAEASKCLALRRPTACAFHLMRAVECALDAMRLSLGLREPEKSGEKTWGAVLGTIQTEIENKDKLTHTPQWSSSDDRRVFRRMLASLNDFKENWRDPTMHLESTYTEEQAEHLFALTKGFMQVVASRLDEDGQPLA